MMYLFFKNIHIDGVTTNYQSGCYENGSKVQQANKESVNTGLAMDLYGHGLFSCYRVYSDLGCPSTEGYSPPFTVHHSRSHSRSHSTLRNSC